MERDIFWKFIDEINATVDSNDEDAVISATKKKAHGITLNEDSTMD